MPDTVPETPVAPDASASEPAAPAEPGFEARLKALGVPTEALDPEDVHESLEFYRSAKGKKLLAPEEIDALVHGKVRDLLSAPEARGMVKQHYGFRDAEDAAEAEADPVQRELKELRSGMQTIAQQLGSLGTNLNARQQQEQAQNKARVLLDGLAHSVRAIPGAEDVPQLGRLFKLALEHGDVPEDATTAVIQRWVRKETAAFSDAAAKIAAKRAKPPASSLGGDLARAKLAPDKNGSVADAIADQLGLA